MRKRKIIAVMAAVATCAVFLGCKSAAAPVKDTAVEVPEVIVADAVVIEPRTPEIVKVEAGLDEIYNSSRFAPLEEEEELESAIDQEEIILEEAEELPPAEPDPEQVQEVASNYIGNYMITWYCGCQAHCGNNIGALGVAGGLQPYVHCAVPSSDLLGCYIYVEGVGTFYAADISPAGIIDIFVSCSNPPAWGCIGSAAVYIV